MKDFTFPIDVDHSLVNQSRSVDDKVSPTVVSCDAATVASYESTNENGATTAFTTSSTSSNSSSSEAAVIVEHRSWTTRTASKRSKGDTIPKAITLTTTTAIPKQQHAQYSPHRIPPSSGSSITSSVTSVSTAELYQQLQKRLRPEDIPSIPTLSSRNQRRRYSIPSTPTATTDPLVANASYRPVCNFVNYMGTNSRTTHGNTSSATRTSCNYPRFGKFPKSLITLHDDNDMEDMRVAAFDDSHHFASIVTIDDSDDDMLLLSNLDTLDWGILPIDIEGIEMSSTEKNDAFILNESKEVEMMLSIEEPYRFSSTGSVPIVSGSTANKLKHLDHLETLIDHNDDRALFDSFALPHCHDDATDLFDFDL